MLAIGPSLAMRKIFTFKNKRHLPKWLAWILAGILKLYSWTFRIHIEDPHGVLPQFGERAFAIALWHNRVLFATPILPRKYRKQMAALVSASRDGEYISTLISCFGMDAIRGSSSRGGAKALLEMRRQAMAGRSLVLTVDGPRGPKYVVHPGAVGLARDGEIPLVPVSFNAKHYWQLHSWDRMQIPWPFTRMTMVVGEPLELPSELSTEEGCEQLRMALLKITCDRPEKASEAERMNSNG